MLKVEGLNAGYGAVNILWDVSFELKDGQVVAILGSNGAGKTTMVRAITGMIKPASGSIVFDGEELVGRLEFSFDGNVMSIDHTYAFKKGMGIGGVLLSAANDYAISKGLKVKPVCSFASAWYLRNPQFKDLLVQKD